MTLSPMVRNRALSEGAEGLNRAPVGGLAGWEKKKEATITILILLTTYLVLNVWFWLLTLGDAFYIFSDKTLDYTTIWNGNMKSYVMTYFLIYIHTVVLNSSANAVIYILRLKGIKAHVLYLCRFGRKTEINSNNVVFVRKRTALSAIGSFASSPSFSRVSRAFSLTEVAP